MWLKGSAVARDRVWMSEDVHQDEGFHFDRRTCRGWPDEV